MLKLLKIPFNNRWDFWTNNQDELEYIYNDFIRESKKIKCLLHPDNGGDTETFTRFNGFCQKFANTFHNHGIGPKSALAFLEERTNVIARTKAKRIFKLKQSRGATT